MISVRGLGRGISCALGAAALFGASTPLAKALLGVVSPWLLAGLLYLASDIGLAAVLVWQRWRGAAQGAPLRAADLLERFLRGRLSLTPNSEWRVEVDERRWIHFIRRYASQALVA